MHNQPKAQKPPIPLRRAPRAPAKPTIRRASRADIGQICELVAQFSAQGLMLPRTSEQISAKVDSYVVASDQGRVVACAALEEYSPSLAEVSSVAVAPSHHSQGLGTQVVLGVERLARARDIEEVFALSLSDNFFLGLSYKPTSISRYPEKLARYEALAKAGVEIVPKTCFQKVLGKGWSAPQLVGIAEARKAEKKRRVG
ncbi:MAG TPA: GNAT family N-acetyltransferase [Gemmatimonadaceae bacterium]|nr:GNAT family N-acetyltransferase [Gemmatimonadaceae bacterium]